MSLKTGNSRRVAKSRPVCMGLKTQPTGVFSRFSIKIIYIKINYFACDQRKHVTA
jgi:hypothetical protein